MLVQTLSALFIELVFRTRPYNFEFSVSFVVFKRRLSVNTAQIASVEELFVLQVTNGKGKGTGCFSEMLCGYP